MYRDHVTCTEAEIIHVTYTEADWVPASSLGELGVGVHGVVGAGIRRGVHVSS